MSGGRTLCCHVSTATLVFAFYYLIVNTLKLVGIVLSVCRGKEAFPVPYIDISTNILMLISMSIAALLAFFSKRKGPMFVLPFLLMMFVELGMSFLSLFDGVWSLPGTPNYRDLLQAAKSQIGVPRLDEEFIGQLTMWYSILFMTDVLLKVYALQVSMRYFYMLKAERTTAVNVDTGNTVTVKLPSYAEALRMKAEDTPPTYQEP
ncbi:mtp family protein isoform X2 [Danio aesculapii]|uniref:mtp family protein isoform X2 n=1 Tax=Danio aesculapii TaxID=1142201 RepID=UPI0024BFD837|nr:mtp family protein isoform X2 [Danio aesculapii]